jgi:hypothetical protein
VGILERNMETVEMGCALIWSCLILAMALGGQKTCVLLHLWLQNDPDRDSGHQGCFVGGSEA